MRKHVFGSYDCVHQTTYAQKIEKADIDLHRYNFNGKLLISTQRVSPLEITMLFSPSLSNIQNNTHHIQYNVRYSLIY